MKVGFCQIDIFTQDIEKNLSKVEEMVKKTKADIIVLPEFFNTGISFVTKQEAELISEDIINGKVVKRLNKIAAENNTYLIGALVEKHNEYLYNTAVVIGPKGLIDTHRKVYLTDFEKDIFDAGSKFEVLDIQGVKVGVVVCYECSFKEISEILKAEGVQLICHTANIDEIATFDMCKDRAKEAGAYFISCNRIGSEKNTKLNMDFIGRSSIIDRNGNVIAQAGDKEEIKVIDILNKK
ncbi:MAG: hypothetical protein PUE01_00280 [Clostridiaceae bacterium]|nr:hypothetical protein [Clostridiaceae bacterium]